MVDLVGHLESTLGQIEAGWRIGQSGQQTAFQVARFAAGPVGLDSEARAFSTLGLSRHLLGNKNTDRTYRVELLALAQPDAPEAPIVSFLADVGEDMLRSHGALLHGAVIGARGPLFPGSAMTALYVAPPVYFPDSFSNFDDIVIAWLIPITGGEASFVSSRGWREFEDRLVEQDPDLTNFWRPEVRLV